MCAVNLKDCIEELLKLTLQFSVGVTLEFDIGLSKDFCSRLLQPQPCDVLPLSHSNDSLEGVPVYPLYKRLALALQESMTSGTFYRTYSKMAMISVEESLERKESEWQKLVSEKGSEIVNILKTVDFELDVEEPFFSQLKDGLKTIEGRCGGRKYSRIGSGNLLLFNKCIVFEVQDVHWYPSVYNMLEAEGLANVLPGVESLKDGVQIYRKFYTEEKERSSGVLAIGVSKAALQPYISMASMLSGLSYEGVQRLLGLTSTKGTIEYALPPPRSSLLSSFMSPYKPNETSGTLTVGARALAKHVHRSSNKYWGTLDGTNLNKNKLALDVITHLVTNCCWLNVHTVSPHGEVFEIRVDDGYGARWSKDGSKFIGFLEPYVEDGHSVGWKL